MKRFLLLYIGIFFTVASVSAEDKAIDPALLTPNVTPGSAAVGDINRARQYYDSLENFSRKQKIDETTPVIIKEELKLPPRKIQNAPKVYIKEIDMSITEIFTIDEINEIKALVEGKYVTAEDLNNLMSLINGLYIKRNVLTAKAYLPQDALRNAILKIMLVEAKLGKVEIENNRYTRDFFIRAYLEQKEGDVLDITTVEKNLRQFNQNARGTLLKAKLKPGEAENTTDIVVVAEEEFPIHLSGSLDNFGGHSTGKTRYGAVLSFDSVIGFQDRLSVAGNWSDSSRTAYVDYNFPLNTKDTRLGISYMYGDSDITNGPYRDFDIHSKTETVSAYVSHPFIRDARTDLSGVASLNYKVMKNDISDFNYTSMDDVNLGLGINYQHKWDDAFMYTSHTFTNGYIDDKILRSDDYFFKYTGDVYGVKYYDNGIVLTGKFSAQYVPQDVPFIEQAQVGGMSTVRGYDEGLLMGHSSFVASVEALFPLPFLPKDDINLFSYKTNEGEQKDYKYNLRNNVKFATFVDTGGVYRHKFTSTSQDYITGAGVGFRASITKNVQARLYWAYAVSHDNLDVPDNNFHFDVILAAF